MRRHQAVLLSSVLAIAAVALSPAARAEEEFNFRAKYIRTVNLDDKTIVATRADHAPKFDGTLNDPLWKTAGTTHSAFANFPAKDPCGRQTVVFCCYDDNALYIAFDCEEPELDQQQIDNKNVLAADHVGVYLEVGDTRGRGVRCGLIGNRSGSNFVGPWKEQKILYECKAGPNRWYTQIGIPFSSLHGTNGAPLRGEVWGIKFTRYGKNSETGAQRMRSCWPHIPTISEDVVSYNANLCFGADNILENGSLKGQGGVVNGWTVTGAVTASDAELQADGGAQFEQKLPLRAGSHYSIEWLPGAFTGEVSALIAGKAVATQDLKNARVDFDVPAGQKEATVAIKLKGHGPAPTFRMSALIDNVPSNWICLTNNDWVPQRNLKNRMPQAPEGVYTYLKTPMRDFGRAFYKSLGCPDPSAKDLPYEWAITGKPMRKAPDAPPHRTDIGEEDYENFPYEVIYTDNGVPEFCGLPSGSFDAGGMVGDIPFSKGSLTGDPSWAGWPVNRWAGVAAHDILFNFKDKYFIRRIDIQQINSGVRNLDIQIRPDTDPKKQFVTIYRFNGPGTPYDLGTVLPVYFSQNDLNSMAQEIRLSLGVVGKYGDGAAVSIPNLGRPNCMVGLYGINEIWIWAEPKGDHADNDIKEFKPFVPDEKPTLQFDQLKKLPDPVIWPRPKELVKAEGRFEIKSGTALCFPQLGRISDLAKWLSSDIKEHFCADLALKPDGAPGDGSIYIGVKGIDNAFEGVCKAAGIDTNFSETQSYVVKVTPRQILVVACDVEGAAHGIRTLMQWIEHDETTAFARGVVIHDWPVLKYRTVVPSSDHRRPLLPFDANPWNYYKIIDSLTYLRFNSVVDWLPTELYQNSEEKTRQLIHYAGDRFTEIRPALWVQRVPGDCIEANPDDQPDGQGGIANSDGWWESENMCPSNGKSYLAIEEFLDKALKTHDTSPFVEVGFMGSMGKAWNVCRLCRKRNLSGFDLYAEFINRVNGICRKRDRNAIFTNAIMFSAAMQRASGGQSVSEAFDSVNRGIGLRYDNPAAAAEIVKSGFWTISKPWSTPLPVNSGQKYSWGGNAYFDTVNEGSGSEGVLAAGERCEYEYYWRAESCAHILLTADAFWNGKGVSAGLNPAEYAQAAANANVRYNERISTGVEYPSWRTGMTPKFFTVDIRGQCNRSHIDNGTASGTGRSGPKEGVNGFGAAFDFRRVPVGTNNFAGIPFEIVDPNQNNWKSMIVMGTAAKEALIPGASSKSVVPIGKKTASLCVLRTVLRTVFRAGQLEHYPNLLQPAYIFEYADGTRCACDWEMRRHFDDITRQCFYYGAHLGQNVMNFMLPSVRIGFATNTLSGAGANLFVNELVNPYPDKEVRNLIIQLPNPEQRDFPFEFHDAIFAISGVEPVEWDVKYWSQHPPRPLLPANADLPEEAKKIKDVKIADDGKLPLRTYICTLPKASDIAAVNFRLFMPAGGGRPMLVRYRHGDVSFAFSSDGKTWTDAAKISGCTGMDGAHILAFSPKSATQVKVTIDCTAYPDEDPSDIGLLSLELYTK